MKKRNLIIISALVVFVVWLLVSRNSLIPNQKEQALSGVIEDVNTNCYVDGICMVRVNGNWIITNMGEGPDPGPYGEIISADGEILGDFGGKNAIGKRVEYRVGRSDDGEYTLYGDDSFYIKFLE